MKKTIAVTMALTMTAAALAGCSSSSSAPATTAAPKTEAGSEASGDTQAAGSEDKKGGGKYYHADSECYTVDKQYLPLASFQYKDINKSPYDKLKPCPKCNAPERPSK